MKMEVIIMALCICLLGGILNILIALSGFSTGLLVLPIINTVIGVTCITVFIVVLVNIIIYIKKDDRR